MPLPNILYFLLQLQANHSHPHTPDFMQIMFASAEIRVSPRSGQTSISYSADLTLEGCEAESQPRPSPTIWKPPKELREGYPMINSQCELTGSRFGWPKAVCDASLMARRMVRWPQLVQQIQWSMPIFPSSVFTSISIYKPPTEGYFKLVARLPLTPCQWRRPPA